MHARHAGRRRLPRAAQLGFVTRGRPRGALARFLRWTRTDATARRVIATRYVLPWQYPSPGHGGSLGGGNGRRCPLRSPLADWLSGCGGRGPAGAGGTRQNPSWAVNGY